MCLTISEVRFSAILFKSKKKTNKNENLIPPVHPHRQQAEAVTSSFVSLRRLNQNHRQTDAHSMYQTRREIKKEREEDRGLSSSRCRALVAPLLAHSNTSEQDVKGRNRAASLPSTSKHRSHMKGEEDRFSCAKPKPWSSPLRAWTLDRRQPRLFDRSKMWVEETEWLPYLPRASTEATWKERKTNSHMPSPLRA